MTIHWKTSLKYGLIASVYFNVIVLGALYLDPGLLIQDYPAAIQARAILPETPTLAKVLMALILWGGVVLILRGANKEILERGPFRFLSVWASFAVVMLIVSVMDVLVTDWLVFCLITPDFVVVPGTEGMPEYKDYWFHLVQFFTIVGNVGLLVVALIATTLLNVRRLGRAESQA